MITLCSNLGRASAIVVMLFMDDSSMPADGKVGHWMLRVRGYGEMIFVASCLAVPTERAG